MGYNADAAHTDVILPAPVGLMCLVCTDTVEIWIRPIIYAFVLVVILPFFFSPAKIHHKEQKEKDISNTFSNVLS